MNLSRALLLLFLVLAGCENFSTSSASAPDSAGVPKASAESQRIAAYYASVQARLLAQGKLRQDYAPSDVPFTAQDLVRDFEKVALYDEYTLSGGEFIEQQTLSSLRRWKKPVRVGVYFGASVPADQRVKDLASVRSFANRLAGISKLNIRLTDLRNANFILLFLNRDEQKTQAAVLANSIPQLLPTIVREIQNSPRNIFCVAYALSSADNPTDYSGAVILVKGEHLQIMRDSCIQEEMTQALGLANDSPGIRPSIFNDDEEFALLTRHDEMLLKMLYDPRLKEGMTPDLARPILLQIAQDVMKSSRI